MIRFIGVAQFVRDDVLERTDVVRVISGLRRLGQEVGWTKAARTEYAVELCYAIIRSYTSRGAGPAKKTTTQFMLELKYFSPPKLHLTAALAVRSRTLPQNPTELNTSQ